MSGNQYVYVVETTPYVKLVTKNRKEAIASFTHYVARFESDEWLCFDSFKLPSGQLHKYVRRGDRSVVVETRDFQLFERSCSIKVTAWVIKWAKL